MKTKLKQIEKLLLPARLVWDAKGPEGPKSDEKPKDNLEFKENEKWDQKKMDEVGDRIKSLNLSSKALEFKLNKGEKAPNAVNFKQTLTEALKSMETDLKVKNLSTYMLEGLMRRLGIATDDKIGENYAEKGGLTEWLNRKGKEVKSFNIVDGQWVFYTDKEGKTPVQADCVIDQPPAKDPKAPKEKPKTEQKDKFDVSTEVTKAKENDKAKKEQEAKDAKTEEERLKPENLEKVNSDVPQMIANIKDIDDFSKKLSDSTKPKKGEKDTVEPKPAIKDTEIRSQILKYIKADPSLTGPDEKTTFDNFWKKVQKADYMFVAVDGGKIAFIKSNGKDKDSNPLGVSKTVNGAQEKAVIYAHEKLEGRAQEKAKEDKAKADKATEVKPTKYDGTEQETAKLITGKDKLEKGDLDKVDARYLDAMRAILEYKDGGPAKEFSMMINDAPLKCKFQKVDGKYEIRWGEGNRYYIYNPKLNSESPLKDAQKFYAEALNNGRIARELQLINVKDKANYKVVEGSDYGQVIDDGPKVLKDGKIKFEFDWANGIGGDPDVTIDVLPHGELAVHIDVSGIGMDGEKSYDFRAGTFKDMMRTLKTLQKYVEGPKKGLVEDTRPEEVKIAEKENLRKLEVDRRFFDKGRDALQSEASGLDAGKILRVSSAGPTVESKVTQGYYLDIDWMQRLEPAQKMQIVRDGEKYLVTVEPRGLILGRVEGSMPGGFRDAMKLVAESKLNMTLKEAPKMMRDKTEALLKSYNEKNKTAKTSFGPGVEVISYTDGNVMLSRDGMASKSFQLGQNEKGTFVFNESEFKRAIDQGYFVKDNPNFTADKAPKKPENLKDPKDLKATVEKQDEIVDGPLKGQIAKEILTKEVGSGPNWERLRVYVITKMIKINAPDTAKDDAAKKAFYQELTWKLMAQLVIDEGLIKEFKLKGENPDADEKKKVSNALKAPKFKEAFDKDTLALLDGKLKDFPSLRGYIKSLMDRVKYDPKGADDQDKAMQLYRTKMIELVEGLIKDNPIDKKKETQQKYEERIFNLLRLKIKNPEDFTKEYKDNAQAGRDYEKATKDFEAGKSAAEGVKKSPHAKTFEEWDKEGRIGVGTDAWEALNKTAGVDKKNVWLSRIDYGALADQKISFNVRYGQTPNERPMTLHFSKDSKGQTMVSASEGWNNKVFSVEARPIKKDQDTVKDVLDYLAGITKLSYAKSGDEKPVGAAVEQPKAPEKPVEPLKPVNPDAPKPPAVPDKPVDQPKPNPGQGGGGKEAPKPGAPDVPKGQPTGVIAVEPKSKDKQ